MHSEVGVPARAQSIRWSPNTLGDESTVTVTFKKQGEETLMSLVHSDLPEHELARGMRKVGTTFWEFFVSNLEMAHARSTAGMKLTRL